MSTEDGELVLVENQHFFDCAVPVDGHHYKNCTFDRCRLEYAGGMFAIDGCHMLVVSWRFSGAAHRVLNLMRDLCDNEPDTREYLFPNWHRWGHADDRPALQ